MEGIGSVLVRVPGDQLMAMISAVSDPPLTAVPRHIHGTARQNSMPLKQ